MSDQIDPENLERAIYSLQGDWLGSGPGCVQVSPSDLKPVIAAARAHLATLPMPPADHVVVVFDNDTREVCLFDTGSLLMRKDRAMAQAAEWSMDNPGVTYTVVKVTP